MKPVRCNLEEGIQVHGLNVLFHLCCKMNAHEITSRFHQISTDLISSSLENDQLIVMADKDQKIKIDDFCKNSSSFNAAVIMTGKRSTTHSSLCF